MDNLDSIGNLSLKSLTISSTGPEVLFLRSNSSANTFAISVMSSSRASIRFFEKTEVSLIGSYQLSTSEYYYINEKNRLADNNSIDVSVSSSEVSSRFEYLDIKGMLLFIIVSLLLY